MDAKMNQWDEEEIAAELATSLRDQAVSVLGLLDEEQRCDYQALVQALKARFEPGHQTKIHREQLKTRLRKKGESLTELAQDFKRTVHKAGKPPAGLSHSMGPVNARGVP